MHTGLRAREKADEALKNSIDYLAQLNILDGSTYLQATSCRHHNCVSLQSRNFFLNGIHKFDQIT